jgi:hypothetical protein
MYKVYARPNDNNEVTRVFSTCFEQPGEGDILLKEGNGDEFVHVQGAYQLYDDNGRYNYRMADGEMELIPEDEKPLIVPPVDRQDEINAMLMLEIAKLKAGV